MNIPTPPPKLGCLCLRVSQMSRYGKEWILCENSRYPISISIQNACRSPYEDLEECTEPETLYPVACTTGKSIDLVLV